MLMRCYNKQTPICHKRPHHMDEVKKIWQEIKKANIGKSSF